MSKQKDKPANAKSATKKQPKNVAVTAETHSQDADRHRRVKHPVSEK